MNAWVPDDASIPGGIVVAPSQTKTSISKKITITASGSKNFVLLVDVSVAGSGTSTLGFKTFIGSTYSRETKTASITTTGKYELRFNSDVSADQAYLPLLSMGELLLTTPAGVTVTVNSVETLQEK